MLQLHALDSVGHIFSLLPLLLPLLFPCSLILILPNLPSQLTSLRPLPCHHLLLPCRGLLEAPGFRPLQ